MAAPGEQGFAALPQRRVGWPMGEAGRARLPGFFHHESAWGVGFRQGMRRPGFNEERREK